MERMTIPDIKIDENTTSRSVIDAGEVKKCAMQLYWHLKKIEDILGDDYDLDRLREIVKADRDGRCTIISTPERLMVYENLECDVKPERLLELAKADRDGRCVVLPCKVGDTVFQINQTDVFAIGIKKLVYDCGQVAFDETAIGVSIFTDREAAEAALKGEKNGCIHCPGRNHEAYPGIGDENYKGKYPHIGMVHAEKIVSFMPAADVEPVVHGKWLSCFEDWRMQIEGDKCSICGFEHYGTPRGTFKFCPNCGAKMDRQEEGK